MRTLLIQLPLASSKDVAHARQQVRGLCLLSGAPPQSETRFATVASELARHAIQQGGGSIELIVRLEAQAALEFVVRHQAAPAAIAGLAASEPANSFAAALKLAEWYEIESEPKGGQAVRVALTLPQVPTADALDRWRTHLQQRSGVTQDELLSQQNRELTLTLQQLQRRELELQARMDDIDRLNRELEANNRGLLDIHRELAARNNELDTARAEAETAAAAKAAFLANMSHEIRTPMNAIVGLTDLLGETQLNEPQQELLHTVQSSTAHLLSVLNDVLDFSKIESGHLELESRRFELRQCVEEALELVALQAAQKKLELACVIAEGTPEAVRGDMTRVRQVLANFLANAVKFTASGEIIVQVRGEREASGLYELRFEVQDTGIGIAPGHIDRMFRVFSQADASTTRQYGGSGLGLAICKRLAEGMGGSVGVESSVGMGSKFWFTLRAPECPEATGLVADDALHGRRLLVVERTAAARVQLQAMAQRWGVVVKATGVADDALLWLSRDETFDLVILGSRLSDRRGVELARQIRQLPGCAQLPLVLARPLGDRMATGSFFAAELRKPLRMSVLRRVLDSILLGKNELIAADMRPTNIGVVPLRLRVLLAEDNPVNQQVAVKMLHLLGCAVDLVNNGEDAVAHAISTAYDVVLLDLHMPLLDGLAAAQKICEQLPQERRPRLIAFTAGTQSDDRARCLAAGMDDYLSKPVQLSALAQTLRRNSPVRFSTTFAPTRSAALDAIQRVVGRENVEDILSTVASDLRRLVDGLRGAAETTNRKSLRYFAHSIRSNAQMLGSELLSARCSELEYTAEDGEEAALAAAAEAVAQDYEALVHSLRPA